MPNHSSLIDDGAKFQIIPNTRKVVVPNSHKIIGTVGDHNSEQLTFQCPKTIDGHDIANCTDKYVSWTNAAGRSGSFEITEIETDDENIYFAWVVDMGVTAAAGSVTFSVHFEDIGENGELLYRWGTTECKDCSILNTQTARGSQIPIPDGYVKPDGTLYIVANDTYDVKDYAYVNVNVVLGVPYDKKVFISE